MEECAQELRFRSGSCRKEAAESPPSVRASFLRSSACVSPHVDLYLCTTSLQSTSLNPPPAGQGGDHEGFVSAVERQRSGGGGAAEDAVKEQQLQTPQQRDPD
ncbi:hypothetical protein CgunFtcFv8_023973 [Champsocephalus gunnari]|uniref:Uncharacterized protein n=1 Tax=Champsocephalus gunnari TaxID=52237 RepID=A0AAN8HKV8_CHAGU|nr:hypothetical protein CgunFtcFv8_023973 [Champsocephalus gunnari]